MSGGLSAATTFEDRDSKLNAHSSGREHGDQRVDTEQIDLAANEIANPRLGNSKELCRRTLGQFARPDKTRDFHHQLSATPQALSLLRSEANIPEHIPRRLLNLHSHISRLRYRFWSSSLSRDLARSKSLLAVFLLFFSKACTT